MRIRRKPKNRVLDQVWRVTLYNMPKETQQRLIDSTTKMIGGEIYEVWTGEIIRIWQVNFLAPSTDYIWPVDVKNMRKAKEIGYDD